MHHPSTSLQNSTSGRLFRRMLAVLSGLAMACALLALLPLFPPTRFQYATNMLFWLIIGGLLYFVGPFLLSFFVSWRTGQRAIGYNTGMLTAWTAAMLVLLTLGVSSLISATLFLLFVSAIVAHGCGCLIASGGASAGSALGNRLMDSRAASQSL
jgi:hypothetical protein